MTSHTSGPWQLVVNDDPRGQPSPFYRGIIALVEKGDRHITVVSDGRTVEIEEWEPNGRLIAAAPRLLEAVERILSLDDGADATAWQLALEECTAVCAEARGNATHPIAKRQS